jgi:endonuclease/exonuclease/phosphatase family metal-dependent hydrolase
MHTGETIDLLQWNIWYKQPLEGVLDFLQHMPGGLPDVLCIQELTNGYPPQQPTNTWEHLSDELGYDYRVDQVPVIAPDRRWEQAIGIFSHLPILKHAAVKIHIPDDPESPYDQYRSYLEAGLDTPNGELTVATSHMSMTDPNATTVTKALEVSRVAEYVTGRSRYCFMGDVNAGPGSAIIRVLDEHLVNAGPDMSQPTCSTKPFESDGPPLTYLSSRLDVSYHSPDLEASARILQTGISDHLPILTRVNL